MIARFVVRRTSLLALVASIALAAGSCSSGGDDPSDMTRAEETTSTTAGPTENVEILVTNDDGVGAEGIDALVEALQDVEGVTVTVVAPAENQSTTGDATTDGEVSYSDATTASGYPAVAVDGLPADAVNVALDDLGIEPDLLISGINDGQNLGPFVRVSGTVGVARTAAHLGVPALASSQQSVEEPAMPDFATGVTFVIDWLQGHLDLIAAGELAAEVENLNVPSCETGSVRGLAEVPLATDVTGRIPEATDCESTLEDPVDDVDAFINGFASLSPVGLESEG